ncbi:MAG TPA: HDOD domain-containing protein [Desulfatiglandales bacterium]|nr:HDOD domain-containing protein [Desulfatiglandales bacterium]
MKSRLTLVREPVPSGRYAISKKKDAILEAFLGTCVGVTLCDREGDIGGLIHLLLPEPTETSKPWKTGVYATTGLPVFIQSLCDAGAKKNRLEACIAGGALVGPISRKDLNLDIGGRTAEVVQKILRENGIPVNKAETGGYFSCKICLDLQTLEASIEPIDNHINHISSSMKNFKKPTSNQIAHAIEIVQPIPQVALKIARMIHNEDYNMQEIASEIKQDQIISAKIIRLCNSSYMGLKKKIDSIERALVIMGEKLLLRLVITASVELYFTETGQGYSLCKGGLFQHALGTAIIAEELSKFTGRSSPDIAYTAGLLHDIGKVVLDQYISSGYPFFYRWTQIHGAELCKAEHLRLGITHPEAGRLLAENWSLPENLADTIKHHHYPEESTVDPELTHIVYLADLLMSKFQAGQELECLNTDKLLSRLKRAGFTASQFPTIVDLIPQKILDASFN